MQQRSNVIQAGDDTVIIKEMTVSDVRKWLKDVEQLRNDGINIVTEGIMGEASLTDVVRMTNLDMEDLDKMLPSYIDVIIAACREMNPHFFRLRDRLLEGARLEAARLVRLTAQQEAMALQP